MKELSPKQIGLNTELHCISQFSDCGFLVSTPYGDNGRYDLIVDVNGHLFRVQVKTASLNKEATGIKFSCKSARINTKGQQTKRYSKDEIDQFATYWNNRAQVVPIDETSTIKNLRFYNTENGQDHLTSFIEDYTVANQWGQFLTQEQKDRLSEVDTALVIYKYSLNDTPVVESTFCKRCGTKISTGKTYCIKCSKYLSRKVERPKREELKEMIRKETLLSISKKYGVSDKAIAKWCKSMSLPYTKKEINSYSDAEWELI